MAVLLAVAVAAGAAASATPVLYGYDTVAYFSLPAAANGTRGSAQFSYDLETHDYTT